MECGVCRMILTCLDGSFYMVRSLWVGLHYHHAGNVTQSIIHCLGGVCVAGSCRRDRQREYIRELVRVYRQQLTESVHQWLHTHEIRPQPETDLIDVPYSARVSPIEDNGRTACAPDGAILGPSTPFAPCYTMPPSHYFRSVNKCPAHASGCHRKKANDGTGQAELGQFNSLLIQCDLLTV